MKKHKKLLLFNKNKKENNKTLNNEFCNLEQNRKHTEECYATA